MRGRGGGGVSYRARRDYVARLHIIQRTLRRRERLRVRCNKIDPVQVGGGGQNLVIVARGICEIVGQSDDDDDDGEGKFSVFIMQMSICRGLRERRSM